MIIENYSTKDLIKELLIRIGDKPDRVGLINTPERVTKMYKEIFKGYDKTQMPNITTFPNGQDGIIYDQMIIDEGTFYSNCEHHMLPFFGKYWFGYIPNAQGLILGLSKIARVIDYYSSRLQTQERIGGQVINILNKALTFEKKITTTNRFDRIKPLGMALTLRAKHLCKCMRGVKNDGLMTTTVLEGVFKDDAAVRQEFMRFVK